MGGLSIGKRLFSLPQVATIYEHHPDFAAQFRYVFCDPQNDFSWQVLQTRKLRINVTCGHTATKWQRKEISPWLPASKALAPSCPE